ncbi:glycoside hydrolase family 3 N-terminal domain-containing protein [Propionimicrobium sp. PCR01-08-3]|uniref:glycoside hydrolase family 3 protein n=1 Tax=Propionimicrobium sp. PCR01-08-3 TaxID=3052086 RepID=UPI00255D0B67|nr:glycoside hydrolase family 3 N-terminal domain-containing protein [Propionimicrobium sp. PCR01-08-3]WIY81714.1 glycoside hydrolase family 3 N-terminal domain-containing protein [Propionimicrobium sp. PCR01-08-3]
MTERYPASSEAARSLVARMSLDDKLVLITGADYRDDPDGNTYAAGFVRGLPHLGIPALRLADGPSGIATRETSTGMTSTMGVAASWSTDLARENGVVIGRDARALGQDVTLQPFINIDRDVTIGRTWNTLGEDPLLAGAIGAAQIEGIQSQHVMAQAKHFIGYDGAGGNVVIDEQTLHEVYLKPFEDAVCAGVSSVMAAYNEINGEAACGSRATMTGMLREQLGFEGFITSDWGGNHSTAALAAGLDQEMPGAGYVGQHPQFFGADQIKEAIANGDVSEADVDRAVTAILTQYHRFGLLDGVNRHVVTEEQIEANADVVRRTATAAAVLLKNDDAVLPLSAGDLDGLVLIGPGAGRTIATGGAGESSTGRFDRWIGVADILRDRFPKARIGYQPGIDLEGETVPATALSANGAPGLIRVAEGITDETIRFTVEHGTALAPGSQVTWTGTITTAESGDYRIGVGQLGATAAVEIDDTTVIADQRFYGGSPRFGDIKAGDSGVCATSDGLDNRTETVHLEAGAHPIRIAVNPDESGRPVQVHLRWVTPAAREVSRQAAIEAARTPGPVVVFAYAEKHGNVSSPLPEGQDDLIAQIAAVNPRTIVVLQHNNPVMMPWLDDVRAVLCGWFPGDEGGWAFADLLTGIANPGGHLPFTWPAAIEQGVASDRAHPERSSRGVLPGTDIALDTFDDGPDVSESETRYTEGVNVGYRWYDKQRYMPLFAFGHGLSYTGFAFDDLAISAAADGSLELRVRVTNTGDLPGDVVVQAYLGAPPAQDENVMFAHKTLAAFTRVGLNSGESRTVVLHIARRELSYWSPTRHEWTLARGERHVFVGDSSADLHLHQAISIG